MQHIFNIKVGNKNVDLKAITLREYMELLALGTGQEFKDKINGLLKPLDGFNKVEKEFALVSLLAKSITNHHQASYFCACGKETNVNIDYNLMQLVIPESDTVHSGMYQLSHFKVKLKYPTDLFSDSNMFDLIISCIDGIYTESDVLRLEDLSDQEMDNFINAFTVDDVLKIRKYLLAPFIQIAVPVKCECGQAGVKHVKGFRECLEILL